MTRDSEVEERLVDAAEKIGARYALAEFSGTDCCVSRVPYFRVAAYMDAGSIQEVARMAGLIPVDRWDNVRLFALYDEGAFWGSTKIGNAQVAHPIQLFLDLNQERAAGKAAARFLSDNVLKPEWRSCKESIQPSQEAVRGW